jgi:Cft2 family RNA processing exonuclease
MTYELERPFDYPGNPHNAEPPFVLATKIGEVEEMDEDGETRTRYYLYSFSALADNAEIAEWVEENFPSTWCQHSHDCCGHWYDQRGQWSRTPRLEDEGAERVTILIRQRSHLNI